MRLKAEGKFKGKEDNKKNKKVVDSNYQQVRRAQAEAKAKKALEKKKRGIIRKGVYSINK